MRSRSTRSRGAKWWSGWFGSALHALTISSLLLGGNLGYAASARAAESAGSAQASAADDGLATPQELEKLLGPVALYPDELLAVVLPASTYPLQIVQASRFLEKREKNPELQPDEEWDESILALLNYPEALELMNDDLNWTWSLGEAVANQQDDVMAAVQSFRAKVAKAGNLESNDKVKVVNNTEDNQTIIVIESTSTEVIYVPTYQPATVVVYHSTPYPYYYSAPYPYYYHRHAVFWTGMFVGVAVGYGMRWGHHSHHRHGNIYVNRNVTINRPDRPDRPDGGRPGAGRPEGGKPEAWQADKGRGSQSGTRPGRDRASAGGGASDRARAGTRPGTSDRSQRQASSATRSSKGGVSQRDRSSSSRYRSSQGRDVTTRSSRSSRSSSVGGYKSGASSRSHSSRGSRGSMGRGGGGRRR